MSSHPNSTRKILLLSANPFRTSQLRLDEEMREIKEGLRRAKKRELYAIDRAEAVRYRDIHVVARTPLLVVIAVTIADVLTSFIIG
ncbi:hypothetical protein NUACC21_02690 [Scytonema sp. NUACC21]